MNIAVTLDFSCHKRQLLNIIVLKISPPSLLYFVLQRQRQRVCEETHTYLSGFFLHQNHLVISIHRIFQYLYSLFSLQLPFFFFFFHILTNIRFLVIYFDARFIKLRFLNTHLLRIVLFLLKIPTFVIL